ncbi:hypothetical protein BDF20DRAFT_835428 [Mycotypha africana]|uniref:uncharacterized protein n=1 Tax=Mycotypha africana TaxID=64632 RepID=UPI002300940C|nr:uncharacterized protein BDF20DRAFT_835428 [Mycotypha africana]KAI8979400.1 hypothetical protein BDF20DRAFT_835428 [Mycotypha africana]
MHEKKRLLITALPTRLMSPHKNLPQDNMTVALSYLVHEVAQTQLHYYSMARFAISRTRPAIARHRRSYVTRSKKTVTTSMGGIFEPFLDNKIDRTHKEEEKPLNPRELLSKVNINGNSKEDIGCKRNMQKEIAAILLDNIKHDKTDDDKILKSYRTEFELVANKDIAELTAFGNILLRSSKFGAPLAFELYKLAMRKGDDRGAFSYANMVYRGYRGTPKNEEKGIQIMSQLAQKGHPYAQMNLAAIIMRTQPDRVEAAIKLYELAGRAGLDQAYTELGRMFRLGYGVHQDHSKAIDYFQKGAQMGNPQCHFMLGVYWSSGLIANTKEPDQKKAFKHFQKAAMKGMAEAQYNVGLRYLKGHGVEQNSFNAVEFFRMAALQGFQLAQVNLAGMYAEGRGVKPDLEESKTWLAKAAAIGGPIGKDAQKRIEEIDRIQGKKDDSKCTIM